jgi:hypothetical protein
MVFVVWELFTSEWLRRSRRKGKGLDVGDRFLCLWIGFNGWMRARYGEDSNDRILLQGAKENTDLKLCFETLKSEGGSFVNRLRELQVYTVANMKYPDDINRTRQYDGSLDSLLEVIYSIRCNLFHGRKNVQEDKKDYHLVNLAYYILRKLFTDYLNTYEPRFAH